jgi:hypothetical protein
MSIFHCLCGFAIDAPEGIADHLGWVFDRDDDIGTDGNPHAEIINDNPPGHLCLCGFKATDPGEFNDHLLIVVITEDAIGIDGGKHTLVDSATPFRWYVRRTIDE